MNQKTEESFKLTAKTWHEKKDGIPMVDYSSQKVNGSPKQHTETIDIEDFDLFLKQTKPFDFDVMLEIKDKEKSAIKAVGFANKDWRIQSLFAK